MFEFLMVIAYLFMGILSFLGFLGVSAYRNQHIDSVDMCFILAGCILIWWLLMPVFLFCIIFDFVIRNILIGYDAVRNKINETR